MANITQVAIPFDNSGLHIRIITFNEDFTAITNWVAIPFDNSGLHIRHVV